MKYQVIYYRQKKDKKSKQTATFYKLEDATFWEKHVETQGYTNVELLPDFS